MVNRSKLVSFLAGLLLSNIAITIAAPSTEVVIKLDITDENSSSDDPTDGPCRCVVDSGWFCGKRTTENDPLRRELKGDCDQDTMYQCGDRPYDPPLSQRQCDPTCSWESGRDVCCKYTWTDPREKWNKRLICGPVGHELGS